MTQPREAREARTAGSPGTSQLDHVDRAMLCRRLLALGQMGGYLRASSERTSIYWDIEHKTNDDDYPSLTDLAEKQTDRFNSATGVLAALDRIDTWLVAAGHPVLADQWDEERMPIF